MIPLPARGILRFRVPILVFWAIVASIAGPTASRVHSVLQVQGEPVINSESAKAGRLIRNAFPEPISKFLVVTLSGDIPIDSAPMRAALGSLVRTAESQSFISRVVSHLNSSDSSLVSKDRKTTFFLCVIDVAGDDSATEHVRDFRNAIHATASRFPQSGQYAVAVTGEPALDFDVRTASREDAESNEKKSLPFAAAILVLAFGALVAAILPLVIGIFAIICALALVYVAASFHPMSFFVLTIISMVGLAVGIDYSLLVVTRFREEMNRGRSPRDAAERTIETAGRAVVTSGLTVALGFASLLVTPISETRSVGIGGLLVVTVAVLLAVTLLPASLSFLGRTIDKPKWLARRLAWYHAPAGWERWARWLGQHPWRAIVLAGTVIALITWPLTNIKFGLPESRWFPANTESAEGIDVLRRMGASGTIQPIRMVIQAPDQQRIVGSRYIRGLKRLSDTLRIDPRIAQVRSVVDVVPNMSAFRYTMLYGNIQKARDRAPDFYSAYLSDDDRTTLMDVLLADTTSLTTSMEVVRDIRSVVRSNIRGLDSIEIAVGGFAASSVDLQDDLLKQFPLVIALVLTTTAVMLFVAFRSILVPLKAVVMNVLSVGGAFGLTVLVFQEGVGAKLFGLDGPMEAIYAVIPVLVFAVVFGLSMDYEVFLLARIKEAFDRTGRNDQATMEGLAATASVITSAAAIMIIVFGVFSFSRVLGAQLLGFGLAVAVFLDATLVRMVLVPAIMHLAGRWNWWPGVRTSRDQAGENLQSDPPHLSGTR